MKVAEIEDLILATVKVKIEAVMMNGHQLARPAPGGRVGLGGRHHHARLVGRVCERI
jgi:hypothetical protein